MYTNFIAAEGGARRGEGQGVGRGKERGRARRGEGQGRGVEGKGGPRKGQNKAVRLVHTGTQTSPQRLHANTMHAP